VNAPDYDRDSREAVAALVRRLRNRGDGEGQFATDDELFAQEFIASLKGYGWRPVLAPGAASDWRRASGSSRLPDAGRPGGAEYLAAKAAIAARTTGPQQVLRESTGPRQEAGTASTEGIPQ
jgi:hypothetical protein